jgi:hypothetical protein
MGLRRYDSRRLRLGAMLALGATAALALATSASAGQYLREKFHDEDTFVLNDFCGVPGMSIEVELTLDGRVQAVGHGPDRIAYFLQPATAARVFTNPANGKSIHDFSRFIEKDLRVTDNGDGTLTILILNTGNAVLYDANDNVLARNPGQVRYEILVDHGGTPADPFDDEFLADLGLVKGSTGRSDDFCAAALPALS